MIDPMQEMDETDSFTEALRTFRDPSIKGDPALMKPQDNASSFFSATDVMLSVPRGVVGAAKGVYNLADLLTFDLLPDWDKNPLGESTSTVGGFVETISEFAVGFLSGSAAISAVSKAGKLGKAAKAAKWLEGPKVVQKMAKGAVAGGVADFTVFEGDEMRLSNLVESIPGLNNPITEFLAAKEDDVDSLTGRLKNVIEGALIGTAVEGAMRGVGSAYRMARGVAAAADVVKQTRLASQSGMSAEEVFRVREAAMEKHKKWLEDVPAATDEYLAQSERRFVEEDAVAQDLKANQPGADRTLQRVLLDSARKRMGGNMPREAARAVEDFIRRVGPSLFDGTTFSVQKMGDASRGQYDILDDIIKIASDVYKGEGSKDTFLHEAWHMLSRYVDDTTVTKLNKDYEKAVASFKKRTGIDPQALKQGVEGGEALSSKITKAVEGTKADFDEVYSLTSLDEWFVANMVDATAKRTARESRRGVFGEVRNVIDAMVDSFRGNRTIDEVADKFLSGGMENRHHRNLMNVYRRSLQTRVKDPAKASDFKKSVDLDAEGGPIFGETLDSIGPLTPDQIKGLDPSIPRAADGTIDAQGLRKELVRLREEGNVNLVPALNDQGVDAAALRLDNYLKTGGVPEPRQTISQADQVAAVEGRRIDLPTDPVEVSKTIDELDAAGAAMHVELSARINAELAQLDEALKAGDNQAVAAAADALRVLEDLDKKLGSGQGRALQRRNNGNIAELVARSPQEAELLGTLLDGVSSVTIVSPKTLFGRFTDAMFKVGKTGLDVSLELFRNSILSGPRTTSVNTLGNLGGMFVNQGELAAGAWLSGKLLGRNRATNINTIATQEGRVLLGYLDQVFDALGMLVGRTPQGGVSAATGRPIALANAAESWRREGMGVTIADRPWSEGIEPPRGIDAQRMELGQASDRVDSMGRQVFEPSPFGHVVNVLGKLVNIPLRVIGTIDEWFSTAIARTNARMFAMRELGDSILKMTPDQIDAHVDGVLKNLFDESGRLYSRKAVEERAIKQAVKEGLDPTSPKGKARILSLVQKGDDAIGFAKYDAKMGHLAEQIEDRVRGATWKRDIDDLINDPLRGAGTALVGNLGKAAQSLVRNIPAAGLILPFIRTPTNLIVWALNRNPASLIWKGIQNDWYKANPARQAELMGRLTTGVALYSAGITLATMGVLTGRGPRDPALRQQLRESGWQPYSIKVGDKYVSYARADPFSTIIGFIADLTDVAHKMEEGEIEGLTEVGSSLIGAMTAVITDKTFISGLTGMFNAVTRPDLYGEQLVKQYASAFVPNFFAQSLTPFSAELEKSRSALDAMMMRIPGWGDESVDRLRNPLGEAMLRDKGPLGNATDVVNPFSITTAKDDPVNNEFINLGRAISSPRRTLPGGTDLWDFRNSKGQTAYDRYQELTSEVRVGNRNLRSRLMSLIQSRQYQSLASGDVEGIESPRAGVLRSEIGRYRKKAFEQLLQEFPDLRLRYMQSNEVRAGMRR